ncbi:uncharacterized protein LOC123531382 [Mercenaria mercenaria]|uniref:uncharacterized protein LOC123531382 n=1 Tax=Mercenaria mercenaria TaxID=6596 RepID=UPI00234E8C24|nr:uncharacterized protein LOC123531382 [Mercenaria mercenaria]
MRSFLSVSHIVFQRNISSSNKMKTVLGTIAFLFVADCVLAGIPLAAPGNTTVDPAALLNNLMGGSETTTTSSVVDPVPTATAEPVGKRVTSGVGPNITRKTQDELNASALLNNLMGGSETTTTSSVVDPVPAATAEPVGKRVIPGVGPNITRKTQEELNALCNQKCLTEVCYLSDNDDCRNFITCRLETGTYRAILQPCAFGTFWAGLQTQKKITCDATQKVACKIDYCGGLPNGTMFDHKDGNCKTYWECINGRPVPKCCGEGLRFRYHRKKGGRCVRANGKCHDNCPIKIDACLVPGTKTEFFDDRNCVTYWDCEERHPHPVCCPEGQGYDVIRGCINNPLCKDECPPQYKPDICLQPGIEKYSLVDGSCRTYMKCNAIKGDERWCCPSGYRFDGNTQKCIEITPNMNVSCTDHCPQNYNEVCKFKAAANKSDAYIETYHGVEHERPCSPGTQFDITKCACATHVPGAPDNSCRKELDIIFDELTWLREGSQKKIKIDQYGTADYGPKLNGRMALKFAGDLVYRIPFFQSQFEKLFIKIVYLPPQGLGASKQNLLSNCLSLDLGGPSMELSIQNNQLVLHLVTEANEQNATNTRNPPVELAVTYSPQIWNTVTAIYDGAHVQLLNEGEGSPTYDSLPLNGTISVAAEGADFGACFIQTLIKDGFRGSVAELEVSKCLHDNWVKEFDKKVPAPPLI